MRQKGMAVRHHPGHDRNEFYQRLIRDSQNLLKKPLPQEGACNLAFLWKSWITSVNKNIRINQRSHDRKVPLGSRRRIFGEVSIPVTALPPEEK